MKLRKEFLAHDTNGKSYLISTSDADFKGIVEGNRTLGIILDLLQTDTTEDQIVSAMLERFDASAEQIRADVQYAVSELRRIGALE